MSMPIPRPMPLARPAGSGPGAAGPLARVVCFGGVQWNVG